ncbi:hypothetical protein T4E_9381 [Trichinella pseudospiralis]|uniref:PiggyBac transposable element-derived protein domain-containing protein n=1 Tax=Trichinella pseudospiralis TaxID=6337 RepID=A0A0V0YNE5_TRIPS|nr:hypothetical protein T4E_9381 [Trichinella pseudospiralis]
MSFAICDSFLDILNDSLEESDIGSASDSDYVEKSDHDTSSEFRGILLSESETLQVMYESSDSWIGRDHVCSWNKQEPSKNVRTRTHNIYSRRQGSRRVARRAKMPFEIWSLFKTQDIIDVIVLNTNIYISNIWTKCMREKSAKCTDGDEIKALLGSLLLAGVFYNNPLNLCDLYNTDGTDTEIFSSTMSFQQHRFLLRCMSFDDHAKRSVRKLQEKLTPIRMAAKYGIKIFELSDSETYYVSKIEVYVGKQNEGSNQMDTSLQQSSEGFALQMKLKVVLTMWISLLSFTIQHEEPNVGH